MRFHQQAAFFLLEAAAWLKRGCPVADADTVARRLKACNECEHWDEKAWNHTGKCKICECSTHAKSVVSTAKCPLDKWTMPDPPDRSTR